MRKYGTRQRSHASHLRRHLAITAGLLAAAGTGGVVLYQTFPINPANADTPRITSSESSASESPAPKVITESFCNPTSEGLSCPIPGTSKVIYVNVTHEDGRFNISTEEDGVSIPDRAQWTRELQAGEGCIATVTTNPQRGVEYEGSLRCERG